MTDSLAGVRVSDEVGNRCFRRSDRESEGGRGNGRGDFDTLTSIF